MAKLLLATVETAGEDEVEAVEASERRAIMAGRAQYKWGEGEYQGHRRGGEAEKAFSHARCILGGSCVLAEKTC